MKKHIMWVLLCCSLMFVLNGCTLGKDSKVKVDKKPSLDTSEYESLSDNTVAENSKIAVLTQDNENVLFLSAKQGLERLSKRLSCEVTYVTYEDDNDYETKVKEVIDDGNTLLWIMGSEAADINDIACKYEDTTFAIVGEHYEEINKNVVLISFKDTELGFFAGYVAAARTESNKTGIMCFKEDVEKQYIYGFKAGVSYACYELDKKVDVKEIQISNQDDAKKIQETADKAYGEGVDVIYVVPLDISDYVILAADDRDCYVIASIQEDSTDLATDVILADAAHEVDSAVELASFYVIQDRNIQGAAYEYGFSEGALDIELQKENVDSGLSNRVNAVKEIVLSGALKLPDNEEDLTLFKEKYN